MIRRVVLLRLHPERVAEAGALGTAILALLRSLPAVQRAEVARRSPTLPAEGPGWDLCVTVDLAGRAELRAYLADPVHAAFVRDVLAPCVAERSAASLELLEPEPAS